jgi:hypothetical protein
MKQAVSRFLVCLLALLVCAGVASAQGTAPTPAPAPSAAASTSTAAVQSQLQLERKLLALDLVSYRETRAREQAARTRVDEATQRLDQALGGSSLALGTLETLFDDLSAARAAAQVAAERVDWQVQRLQDRMRRISFMEGEGGGTRTARSDSVAGRWRVQIRPQNVTGVYDLRLDGTVVSGTYEVGTSKGSLRGTFVDRNLRLERVDSKGGFDSVFLGTFDPAAQTITGSWTANELASGQPNRGEWSAARVPAAEERQP